MKLARQSSLVLGLTLAAGSAFGQVISSGPGYLFRAKYKKGDVLRYGVDAVVKGLGGKPTDTIKVHFSSTMTVNDVKSGIANLTLVLGAPTVGGQPMGGVAGNKASARLDNRNRSMDGPSITNTTAQFPGDPIKIGGTWVANVPVLIGNSKPTSVSTTYKLVGFKMVGGKKLAVLKLSVGGTASGTGELLINTKDGSIFSSLMRVNLRTGPSASYPVDVIIKRA